MSPHRFGYLFCNVWVLLGVAALGCHQAEPSNPSLGGAGLDASLPAASSGAPNSNGDAGDAAPDAAGSSMSQDAGVPSPVGAYGECVHGLAGCTVAGSLCSMDSTGSACAPPCTLDSECPAMPGSTTAPKCASMGPGGARHCYVPCVNNPADTCPAPASCLFLAAPEPQCAWQCATYPCP